MTIRVKTSVPLPESRQSRLGPNLMQVPARGPDDSCFGAVQRCVQVDHETKKGERDCERKDGSSGGSMFTVCLSRRGKVSSIKTFKCRIFAEV